MAKMSNCILNRNQIKISMEWFKCTKNIFFKLCRYFSKKAKNVKFIFKGSDSRRAGWKLAQWPLRAGP